LGGGQGACAQKGRRLKSGADWRLRTASQIDHRLSSPESQPPA
jgi:hypothetical protein